MNYKMSYIGIFLLVSIVVISGCVQQNPVESNKTKTENLSINPIEVNSSNLEIYENSEYRFRIKYPKNWSVRENYGPSIVSFSGENKGLAISIENLTENISTLDKFNNRTLANLEIFSDIIEESKPAKLSKNEGYMVIYTTNIGKLNIKYLHIWTIKNNKAYMLVYLSIPSEAFDSENSLEEMINSFELY